MRIKSTKRLVIKALSEILTSTKATVAEKLEAARLLGIYGKPMKSKDKDRGEGRLLSS